MNDTLVLITHNYPYGHRWDFVEDEIPYLAKAFEKIIVLSLSDDSFVRENISIPSNVECIRVRQKKRDISSIIKAIPLMFAPNVMSEIIFSFKCLGYKNIIRVINDIFAYKYFYLLIGKHIIAVTKEEKNVLYYSYWMNMEAYTLAELKKQGYIHKIITRAHGVDCFIERNYNPYRRLILEQMNSVFPISEAGKMSIETNLCPYIKNTPVIAVERMGVTRNDGVVNPRIENEIFTIVSCSNVIPLKRVDLIADALKTITDRKVEWVHFGTGELLEVLKEKCMSMPKNIHVDFKGYVSKDTIFEFYSLHHVDLFINCSKYEGVPVSVMEALSFGIPVLATKAGGTGEIIGEKCGKLLPVEISAYDLADGIKYYMGKNSEDLSVERERSRIVFEELCNADRNYTKFVERLKRL